MSTSDWVKFGLYVFPVATAILKKCRGLGLSPVLPIIGLAAGILLEMRR